MAYTKEELDAAIQRKLDAQRAATQNPSGGQGGTAAPMPTPAAIAEALKYSRQEPESKDSGLEGFEDYRQVVRQGLEGATLGASNVVGSAVATGAAFPQVLKRYGNLKEAVVEGLPEAYRDIRGALQAEEDEFTERNPNLARNAERVGTAASLVAGGTPLVRAGAGGLKRATQAALARGRAKVRGTGVNASTAASSGSSGARTGGAAKPRFRQNADGTITPLNKAASRAAAKHSRRQATRDGATLGAEYDLAESLVSGEHMPDATLTGAAAGVVLPSAVRKLVADTPLGRLLLARGASKLIGQKYQPYLYTGYHPTTRRHLKKALGG